MKPREQYGSNGLVAGIGAEAIRQLLEEIDLEKLYEELRTEIVTVRFRYQEKETGKKIESSGSFAQVREQTGMDDFNNSARYSA